VAHACNPSYSGTEIRRTVVRSQPWQTVPQKPFKKKKAGRVAQDIGPEVLSNARKKKKKKTF
jgi:hypothetical protein